MGDTCLNALQWQGDINERIEAEKPDNHAVSEKSSGFFFLVF